MRREALAHGWREIVASHLHAQRRFLEFGNQIDAQLCVCARGWFASARADCRNGNRGTSQTCACGANGPPVPEMAVATALCTDAVLLLPYHTLKSPPTSAKADFSSQQSAVVIFF
eukprot:5216477-Pleurochrysis_carterae.AAC.2